MTTQEARTEIVNLTNQLGYGAHFTGRNAQLVRIYADGGRGEEIVRGTLSYVHNFLSLVAE